MSGALCGVWSPNAWIQSLVLLWDLGPGAYPLWGSVSLNVKWG